MCYLGQFRNTKYLYQHIKRQIENRKLNLIGFTHKVYIPILSLSHKIIIFYTCFYFTLHRVLYQFEMLVLLTYISRQSNYLYEINVLNVH